MKAEELTDDQRDRTWSNDWRVQNVRSYLRSTANRNVTWRMIAVTEGHRDADHIYALPHSRARLIGFHRS